MEFDLRINGKPVTRVSVIRKGPATSTDNREGWFVYEWNAWRLIDGGMAYYAAGELIHCYEDGPEELAAKILREYRAAVPELPTPTPSITCPECHMTSYNPNDIREGYCGNCHAYTGVVTTGRRAP